MTGRVVQLWRYPVKSLLGERVGEVDVTDHGIAGDRAYGLRDLATGGVLSAKQEARLFEASARTAGDGGVEIALPGGEVVRSDDPGVDGALSAWLGRDVHLEPAGPEPVERRYERRPHHFFDSAHVHVLTTASLRSFGGEDVRRFRPNVLLDVEADGFPEDAWVGGEIGLGPVVVRVRKPCDRCEMTTHPQADLPADPSVLQRLRRERDSSLGVLTEVVRPGGLAAGDSCHTPVSP